MISIIFGGINIQPKQAHAIPVVVLNGLITIEGNVSPTELQNTANNWLERIKNWVLDGLAWHIAKMIVQRITASVVQWINSGFSGSPSFLTNPAGFFSDLGDQITGDFIANTGILSGLCSPFNIDVRLSLALGQAGYGQVEKYTCTLSSVINNVKHSTVDGASIGGFMKGDFKQGGWPAFIEVSRPTNNISGAYLKAHSDLLQRTGQKQSAKQQELVQGSGFLSWQECKEVSAAQVQSVAEASAQVNNIAGTKSSFANQSPGQIYSGTGFLTDNTSLASQTGLNTGKASPQAVMAYQNSGQGSISQSPTSAGAYKSCETKTPGSVINGQLEKVLGSGVDQLNLADSINEIVDALIGQLVNQVLQTGLATVSSRPSGQTQSFIQAVSDKANATSTYANDAQNVQAALATYQKNAQEEISYHQQAVDAFTTATNDLAEAKRCADAIHYDSVANGDALAALLTSIAHTDTSLQLAKKPYADKLSAAQSALDSINSDADSMTELSSPEDLQAASVALQQTLSNNSPVINKTELKNEVQNAQGVAGPYETSAKALLNQCYALGGE